MDLCASFAMDSLSSSPSFFKFWAKWQKLESSDAWGTRVRSRPFRWPTVLCKLRSRRGTLKSPLREFFEARKREERHDSLFHNYVFRKQFFLNFDEFCAGLVMLWRNRFFGNAFCVAKTFWPCAYAFKYSPRALAFGNVSVENPQVLLRVAIRSQKIQRKGTRANTSQATK